MSLSEKEISDKLESVKLPLSIKEALRAGLQGQQGHRRAVGRDHKHGRIGL